MYTTSTYVRIKINKLLPFLTALFLGIFMSPIFSMVSESQAQSFAANALPVAGLVQYKAAGSTNWVNLRASQLINKGDEVRTGSNGFARLTTVTGIEVDLFPSSEIGVNNLSMGQDSGQVFDLYQVVGTIFTNVQKITSNDKVNILLPSAGITVHGTQFYTFVSPSVHAAILSQDHPVDVQTGDGQHFSVTPENFAYVRLELQSGLTVCTVEILKAAKSVFIHGSLTTDANQVQMLRDFLHDFITSNLNPQSRAFLRQVLGLPATDPTKMTPQDDETDLKEILTQIDKFDLSKLKLVDFLNSYRKFWETGYMPVLKDAVAPATCGKGDTKGETAQNCPDDFTNKASIGNGICETNRNGATESLVNDPTDCSPNDVVARSCEQILDGILNPPAATKVPHPSGVGG